MQKLEVLTGLGDTINRIDELFTRIDELDQKFNTQVERIDVIQSNVNLTMKSIGEVRQEQVAAAKEQVSKQSLRISVFGQWQYHGYAPSSNFHEQNTAD